MTDSKKIAKTLGANLRRIRQEKNITRQDLAEKLGVTVDTITKYELGERLAPLDKIFTMAKFLDCSIADLTDENNAVIDKKIFEYRLKRALQLVYDAGLKPKEFEKGYSISITRVLKLVKKDGTTSLENVTSVFTVKTQTEFIELTEQAESRAAKMNLSLSDVFKYFVDE